MLLNKNYFLFSLILISRKISIYVSLVFYLLLIFSYVLIVPFLSESSPIELFMYPIAPSFLFFSMVIVSCFISIEIFRTPIDDGTELLVSSKPISKSQICFIKYTVFIMYISIISLLSFVVSSFSHLYPNSFYEDNMNIMCGVFVATFLTGLVFGSISIFISLFFKKILTMLTIVGFVLILNITSMLGSIIFETPAQIISKSENSIIPTNVYNVGNENRIMSGMIKGGDSSSESIEKIYSNALNKSVYSKTIYTDISSQFSTLFSFNASSIDTTLSVNAQLRVNTPFKLNFIDFPLPIYDNNNSFQNKKQSTSFICLESGLVNNNSEIIFLLNVSSKTYVKPKNNVTTNAGGKYSYSSFEIEKIKPLNNDEFNQIMSLMNKISLNLFSTIINDPTHDLYPNFSGIDSEQERVKRFVLFLGKWINTLSSQTLHDFFADELEYNVHHKDDVEKFQNSLKKFNSFIYTYVFKYLNKSNVITNFFSQKPTNNTELIKVIIESINNYQRNFLTDFLILRLMSFDLEEFSKVSASSPNISSIFNSEISFSVDVYSNNNPITFLYKPIFKVVPETYFNSFKEIKIESSLNTYALIFSWLIIGVILMLLTMAIYIKKDIS